MANVTKRLFTTLGNFEIVLQHVWDSGSISLENCCIDHSLMVTGVFATRNNSLQATTAHHLKLIFGQGQVECIIIIIIA